MPSSMKYPGCWRVVSDPMYLNVNGTHLAIRKETAQHVLIEKITHE